MLDIFIIWTKNYFEITFLCENAKILLYIRDVIMDINKSVKH